MQEKGSRGGPQGGPRPVGARHVAKRDEMGHDHAMIKSLKGNWEEFKESKPGERFKDRYNRERLIERHGHQTLAAIRAVFAAAAAA